MTQTQLDAKIEELAERVCGEYQDYIAIMDGDA